jgi:hypothetical protein
MGFGGIWDYPATCAVCAQVDCLPARENRYGRKPARWVIAQRAVMRPSIIPGVAHETEAGHLRRLYRHWTLRPPARSDAETNLDTDSVSASGRVYADVTEPAPALAEQLPTSNETKGVPKSERPPSLYPWPGFPDGLGLLCYGVPERTSIQGLSAGWASLAPRWMLYVSIFPPLLYAATVWYVPPAMP